GAVEKKDHRCGRIAVIVGAELIAGHGKSPMLPILAVFAAWAMRAPRHALLRDLEQCHDGPDCAQTPLPYDMAMFLSVFDVFKIGVGPSSSHTMGPMTAARRFLDDLSSGNWPRAVRARPAAITASLHGSLAFTGIGHGSDRAVILG